MKKPTKEQRHETYRTVLTVYEYTLMDGIHIGLCSLLAKYTESEERVKVADMLKEEMYPEFQWYRPEQDLYEGYWWPLGDDLSRINALKECIKLTE
jgi:hypothetical protein